MIEYKLMVFNRWWELDEKNFIPRPDDFDRLSFKIDGVEYSKWNDKFQHAWLIHELKK